MKDITSIDKLDKFMNEVRLLSSSISTYIVEIQTVSVNGTFVSASGQKKAVVYHATQYAGFGELYKLVKETGCFDERLARTYFLQLMKGKTVC